MAIADIRSNFWRRVILVVSLPLALPLQAILVGAIAAWEDACDWPGLVRGIWRRPQR